MDVGMQNRLSGDFSAIHADIKSLRRELLLKQFFDLSDENERIRVFL